MMAEIGERDISLTVTEAACRVLDKGALAALATLVAAPQNVGAKLLVGETGRIAGGVGDAALEERIIVQASSFLASRVEAQTYNVEDFAGDLDEWHGARVLLERIESAPHVVVCGAGHVGAALARLAQTIGYRVTLIDDRAEFVTRGRFPETAIELVAAASWADAVREAIGKGRGVAVAVVTRGHNEDEECLRAVVAARPDYVGMIGSRRRTNIVLDRLRETGVEDTLLGEVRAPVGLDIGAVAPEEVALAILAEIVAERRGGTGVALSAWRREKVVRQK
ncbi:MAG TPA: XdhC family protein [Pyrinomonadaceae bacterium]|jgi:xanthine dehydrogenase accessory factor|nr:XdhC family protein [Pyrinomonadaceae bacterium]